jgi:hypothetical protein
MEKSLLSSLEENNCADVLPKKNALMFFKSKFWRKSLGAYFQNNLN